MRKVCGFSVVVMKCSRWSTVTGRGTGFWLRSFDATHMILNHTLRSNRSRPFLTMIMLFAHCPGICRVCFLMFEIPTFRTTIQVTSYWAHACARNHSGTFHPSPLFRHLGKRGDEVCTSFQTSVNHISYTSFVVQRTLSTTSVARTTPSANFSCSWLVSGKFVNRLALSNQERQVWAGSL